MNLLTKQLTNPGAVLTCYLQSKSPEMPNARVRPAMLIFPGGGYTMCSDREAEPVALAYMAKGCNAFVLRYSVAADDPAEKAFGDACEALAYLRANAEELDIDKEKIAVIGFSAGGHLAAWLSVLGSEKPNATLLGYPCILPEMKPVLGNKNLPDLCAGVNKNTPPAFVFHTCADGYVPVANALAYANALNRENVPFALHIFAEGGHGLSLGESFTSTGNADMLNADFAQWFALSVGWLKQTLGDFEYKKF